MQIIDIQQVPNQSLTITINGYRYDITLKLIQPEAIACNISIDEQPVIQGCLIIPDQFLMPYRYMEVDGNFFLSVPDDQFPDYEQFGQSQILYHLTPEELELVRNGN